MSDTYTNIIEGMFGSEPATNVVSNISVDPDKTARAMALEKATGIPAAVIDGDVEGFETQNKGQMASSIVANNQQISAYVQSHPLAAKVSNDDYGNLDSLSGKLGFLGRSRAILSAPTGAIWEGDKGIGQGFAEGFGEGGIGSWITPEDQIKYPFASSVMSVIAAPLEGVIRLGSGAIKGAQEGVRRAGEFVYTSVTGDRSTAERFARDLAGIVEMQSTPGAAVHSMSPPVVAAVDAAFRAKRWLENGEEPPAGVHPMIDQIKAERNRLELEQVDEAIAEAQNSTTRERSPELFQNFVRQHVADTQINISGIRLAELYGDRVPLPDDGLLGWVPDIEHQLQVAKETGADVSVPLADWIARVDPAIAKELHDDLRVVKGGLTAREAAEGALFPPRPIVDDPVAALRENASLEPLFSIGDRKLQLTRMAKEAAPGFEMFHDFDLMNENGQSVGTINLSSQKGGKELYIEMINGLGEYYNPNNFGPALMRDLLRQLKAEFPDAEVITGHRVSGARGAAGTYDLPSAMPKIKLDQPLENQLPEVYKLLGGQWEKRGLGYEVYVKPELRGREAEIAQAVYDELDRIVPRQVYSEVVGGISAQGQRQVRRSSPRGMYTQFVEDFPNIAISLAFNDDPVGVARHEAIHHLRAYGFLNDGEWATLEKAAKDNKWVEQFGIERRYEGLAENVKLEEAIADGYKDWVRGKEFSPEVTSVFQKIKDMFDRVLAKIQQVFGKELTWEQIFENIDKGEVGSRTDNVPRNKYAYRESRPPIEDTGLNTVPPFSTAKDVGMNVEQYKRYMKLIEQRQQAGLKSSVDRVLREQTKRQTKEWKEQSEAMRPEVTADVNARPDVAVDKFFGLGELFGEKLDRTYRLDWEALTPEQRKAIPERYTVRRGGVSPDEIASMFGYPSGAKMLEHLAQFTKMREDSGLGRDRFHRSLIDTEINRRMEIEHGFLEKNILEEARDQIFSENQLDLLHEETHALALMTGEQGFNLTRSQLATKLKSNFDALPIRSVTSEKFLREAGKAGKAAEMELLRQNPAEAFKAKQVQYYNMLYADFAKAVEKAQAQLEKTAKPYLKSKTNRIEPAYADHVQKLLMDAGFKVRRSPDELAHSLDFHGSANLADFVRESADQGWDPQVTEALQNVGAKPKDQMTTAEFMDFKDAIDSLNHIGREIRKIEIAGEKQEFAEFKEKVLENIRQLPARPRESQGKWLYNIDASLTRMEEMVKDLDLRQELGPLWDAVIHPMVLSKSKEFDLMSQLAEHFRTTRGSFGKEWRKSLDDTIPNDVIFDPYTETSFDMTRQNLLQIMLNWGNRSNIDKFVQGAGFAKFKRRLSTEEAAAFESQIKALIDTHATANDWEFVRRMWEPFEGWAKEMDTVSRNTSGVAPKWIEIGDVETPHGNFRGGYWPVKYDRLASGINVVKDRSESGTDGIFGTNYFRAATSKGYLKARTGYIDFVDISSSIEQAVSTMQQTIHDISFRDSLMQAGKVFYDKEIRGAIRKHYGAEYEAQLIPWLKRISYQYAADDTALKGYNDFLRRMRINLVGHSLPLNLKVILSPDIGTPNPASWARFEANRKANTELAMTHSSEIRHLVYNLDRDYRDALDRLTVKYGVGDAQKKAIEWGYKPIATVSQEFRMATFVDEFNKQKAAGRTDHEAGLIADSKVREQHGAASVVDLPAALSSNETMKMLTVFQGYFNTMYNWQRQIPGNVRRGEWNKAFTNTLGSVVVGSFFGATMFNQRKQDDSWFKIIAKALLIQPLSTVPILSHATQYAFEGFAPRMPFASLLTAAGSIISDVKKAGQGKPIEKPISHTANIVGLSTGLPLAQVGRTAQFGYDVATGKQRPKNIGDWARGIISGESKLKK